MQIGVIQFPGSNCEQETRRAIRATGMKPVDLFASYGKNPPLKCDGYVIVGGFSYEDRSRAGVIAAHTPILEALRKESEAGKPILGICNGAQILVESGLVPGASEYPITVALDTNVRMKDGELQGTGFYNTWVHIRSSNDAYSAFASADTNKPMYMPVAHAEGRFVMNDQILRQVQEAGLAVFQYCDAKGGVREAYPTTPNGSVAAIAGLGNAAGNILALMPHPERTPGGQPIFEAMKAYIAEGKRMKRKKLDMRSETIKAEAIALPQHTIISQLLITDNHAVTAQQTLQTLGFDITLSRYRMWTIDGTDADATLDTIKSVELLHNSNKELLVEPEELPTTGFLLAVASVERPDDGLKQRMKEQGITVDAITPWTLWHVACSPEHPQELIQKILDTHVLSHPVSQQIYHVSMQPTSQAPNPIAQALNSCLTTTHIGVGKKVQGKVRDRYVLDDTLLLITTDRQSAFDRILASVPFKGQVLNLVSAWWFDRTAHIIPNHMIAVPHPNVLVAKKCEVFPVEFVVRGYLTGSTNTSAWVNYNKGMRNICGNVVPDGMRKNQAFPQPIITPTTKSDEHDELITPEHIVSLGLMTQAEWDHASQKALDLFKFGQAEAAKRGLILVDTKYEMGKDADGTITLVDEIHTPDSSRYWIADTYQSRFDQGLSPEHIDKEFLRLWFTKHCDPYNDAELPKAPDDLVIELSKRYITLFERITGQAFAYHPYDQIEAQIKQAITPYVGTQPTFDPVPVASPSGEKKVVIIMGSSSDQPHADKIVKPLRDAGISTTVHVASAHKQAHEALRLLEAYGNDRVIYVTIAGRSNALSGFVAGHSDKPVIACPPHKDKADYLVNIHSSLQMPSKVPVMTICDPKNCALAIERMFAL